MKNFLANFKEYYSNNKERCLTILTIIILSILSSIILISYSFYQNKSSKLVISGVALIDSSDVSIKVYRENKNDNGVGLGTYSLSYYVPSSSSYSYVESKSICDTGITIEKYENQKFYVDATKKGKCKVYFDAIDGYSDDYEVNLFVQQEVGNTDDKNYNQMGQLPLYETGYYYTINTSKTSCTNGATVSIAGRNIVVLTTQKAVCNVYADKNSDSGAPVISSLSISDTTVTFTATDTISLAFYGVSDSNAIEPEEYNSFSGTSQTVSFTQSMEGTYYLWVKDSAGNIATKEFTISLGIPITTLISITTEDVYNENGLRYEGADPNNYICLDTEKEGSCSDDSFLFRIIGLFDEEYSVDGTTSAGTKKMLKIIKSTTYGNYAWSGSTNISSNDWTKSNLNTAVFNNTFINSLPSYINSMIVLAKWHLGGPAGSNYKTLTVKTYYTTERTYSTSTIYRFGSSSSNPSYVFKNVGLMYPSDYGYAVLSSACSRSTKMYSYSNDKCHTNNWLWSNGSEFFLSPSASYSDRSSSIMANGGVLDNSYSNKTLIVRPVIYIDAQNNLKKNGKGTISNPYRLSY